MKKTHLLTLLCAFWFGLSAWSLPAAAASRRVVLLPVSGDNVDPGVLRAARDLLKDHLQRTGAYTVLDVPGEPTREEPSPADAAKRAAEQGAEQAIVFRIIHFGTSARARLTAYAAGTGQVVYWDSIVIAGGPEELDTVIQRLVHAMQLGKPVRDQAEIDTVTDKETDQLKKREANKSFGLHLFTLLPFNTPSDSFAPVPGAGLFWLYDARSWMADLALDMGTRDGDGTFAAAIGGYYPMLRGDFTPYLGGVVRWAFIDLGGQGASGIMLQPTFGVLLGRLSSVQLRGEVGYFVNTFAEREEVDTSADPSTGRKHFSHGVALFVGLGF